MKLIPLKAERFREIEGDAEMLHLSLGSALGHGPDVRLVIDGFGRVIKANAAAEILANALADENSDASKIIREWAEDDFLGPASLSLTDGELSRRFTLHAIPVVRQNGDVAAILIGREPDLANHLIQAMSASRQLYKDLVSCTGAMVWEVDARGRFSYINGTEELGYSPLELMGATPVEVLGLSHAQAQSSFMARAPVKQVELQPLMKNGRKAKMMLSALPLKDAKGEWRGARGLAWVEIPD